jgi:hypothetical protein
MKLQWPAVMVKYKGHAVAVKRNGIEFIIVAQTKKEIEALWPEVVGDEATEIDMEKVLPAIVKVRRG